jgi:hypothetical protein
MSEELRGSVPETQRSWVSLLGFFAVITLGSSLVFAAVFAGVTAVVGGGGSAQASDDQQVDPIVPVQTFSGIITDLRCGARHTDTEKSAAECTRVCVRDGSKYLLVNGDKNYEITGDPAQISQLAGQRVKLTGALAAGTIKVTSAAALPSTVAPN